MAEADVVLVRRIYAAFGERRFPEEHLAEGFSWTTWARLPDAGVHEGREQVKRFFGDWVGGWSEVRTEIEDVVEAGDRVVVLVHGHFRLGPDSEALQSRYAHVWTVADGRALSCVAMERDEALGDA